MPADSDSGIDFVRRAPATERMILEAEGKLGSQLPLEYVQFLRTGNGGEGFLGKNMYLMLWRVEELGTLNEAYGAREQAPGIVLFGSDGSGEALGFDTRQQHWPIVRLPFIGMKWSEAVPMGDSFSEFLENLAAS